jgi:hypothetical protein
VRCKREGDTIDPKIEILSPYWNQNFTVPGAIHVTANVKDESLIESVRVSLVTDDLIPVMSSLAYYPEDKIFQIDDDYSLDDIHLAGGFYFLMITATDGVNAKNEFVRINVSGAPRQLESILVLTQDMNAVGVMTLKDNKMSKHLFTIESDYSASEVSSYRQQLYFSGSKIVNLEVYDLVTNSLQWSIEPMVDAPFHLPGNLYSDEQLLYVSFRKGFIRSYDAMGVMKFATPFDDYIEPGRIYRHGDLIIADLVEKSGYRHYVASYYYASGILKGETLTNMVVVNFHLKDQDEVFVTGNDSTGGCIRIYNDAMNTISEPHRFSGDKITCSVAVNDDNLLIGTSQAVYWYRYSVNSLVKYLDVIDARSLLYDDLLESVYIIRDKAIDVYTFPVPSFVNTFVVQDTILDAHLLYNK